MPTHGSDLNDASTVAVSAVEVMTSAKSWRHGAVVQIQMIQRAGEVAAHRGELLDAHADPRHGSIRDSPPSQMWSRSSEMPV